MSEANLHIEDLVGIIRDTSKPMHPEPAAQKQRLQEMYSLKAVVFDVYGTLILSGVGDISLSKQNNKDQAFYDALQAENVALRTDNFAGFSERFYSLVEQQREENKGDGIEHPEIDIREIWRRFLSDLEKEGVVEKVPDDAAIECLSLRYECLVNPCWPAPQAEQTIWKLQRNHSRLGIISNAQFFTPYLFDAFWGQSLEDYNFDPNACFWSWKLKEAKPSTRLFRSCAEYLQANDNISPNQVLYVGNDMQKDMVPAGACGFKTALYAGDKRSLRLHEEDPRCREFQPDLVINSWEAFTDCLIRE